MKVYSMADRAQYTASAFTRKVSFYGNWPSQTGAVDATYVTLSSIDRPFRNSAVVLVVIVLPLRGQRTIRPVGGIFRPSLTPKLRTGGLIPALSHLALLLTPRARRALRVSLAISGSILWCVCVVRPSMHPFLLGLLFCLELTLYHLTKTEKLKPCTIV